MRITQILICFLAPIFLSGCLKGVDLGPLGSVLSPEKVQQREVAAQRKAICEWGKAAGLPHTGNKAREKIITDRRISTKTRRQYVRFDKRVVGTSKSFECLCTEDMERRRLLQCSA